MPSSKFQVGMSKGCAVWLTGLPCSGKSTLAVALKRELARRGVKAFVLDGDVVRQGLSRDLGFSKRDRDENIRRVAEVARLFADAGIVCITAFISPYRALRARAGRIVGPRRFLEVHVAAGAAACEARDVKGHYRRAREGRLPGFTGVSAPYEAPRRPDLRLDTAQSSVRACTAELVELIRRRGYLSAKQPGGHRHESPRSA